MPERGKAGRTNLDEMLRLTDKLAYRVSPNFAWGKCQRFLDNTRRDLYKEFNNRRRQMTPHLRLIRGGGYWPVIQSQSKDQTSVETLEVSYEFA